MDAKIITIANRLNRQDSITGLDVWYKTVLTDIQYAINEVSDVVGQTVSVGQVFSILIPFSEKYLPYDIWSNTEDKENYYTLSQGDVIFIDKDVQDVITPNNIVKLQQQYAHNVCEVRSIMEVPKRNGVTIQLKVSGV